MDFDQFVELYVDEYKRCYPGILGLMIKNWMYNDWLAMFHHDVWLQNMKQISQATDEWLLERKESENGI